MILSRLDSKRLPGKALLELAGRPLLAYVVDACRRVENGTQVVVATSDREVDDPLAALANREGVACFRGPTEDVAGRFLQAMEAHRLDAALRVNGDSPLAQTALLARGLAVFREAPVDIATNVPKRTFPFGLSVEVVALSAMRDAYPRMLANDREHVTKYFYDHAGQFRLRSFESSSPGFHGVQLAVDTPRDMERTAWIVDQLGAERLVYEAGAERLVELAQAFDRESRDP